MTWCALHEEAPGMERPIKDDFHHPYTPYEIQLQFMRALYTCLEQGRVGIFESPTGEHMWLMP